MTLQKVYEIELACREITEKGVTTGQVCLLKDACLPAFAPGIRLASSRPLKVEDAVAITLSQQTSQDSDKFALAGNDSSLFETQR